MDYNENMNEQIHTVPFGFGLPELFPILSWWLVNELVMIQSATIDDNIYKFNSKMCCF